MSEKQPPNKLAYSIAGAVDATSVGRSFLYEEIKAGRLKTFKIGSRTLITVESLSSWLASYETAEAS